MTVTFYPDGGLPGVPGGEPEKVPGQVTLVFTRYGDRYFLSRLAGTSHGSRLWQSSAEREIVGRSMYGSLAVMAATRK